MIVLVKSNYYYSSRPHGLWVNSPFGLWPHGLLTQLVKYPAATWNLGDCPAFVCFVFLTGLGCLATSGLATSLFPSPDYQIYEAIHFYYFDQVWICLILDFSCWSLLYFWDTSFGSQVCCLFYVCFQFLLFFLVPGVVSRTKLLLRLVGIRTKYLMARLGPGRLPKVAHASFVPSFYFAFNKKYNNSVQKYIKDNIK